MLYWGPDSVSPCQLSLYPLQVSLEQSGKSRSDLWQLAGLVALEQAVERANRACDLDFHARQQAGQEER